MRKQIGVFLVLLVFIGIPQVVKAASENDNIKSYGSIIYRDSSGSIELYAEDIALLYEKLASVPNDIFDPIIYSHVHEWEYINVNKNTHTRHCAGCGPSNDVVSVHDAVSSKTCTILYGGEEYSGYEKNCRCGYTWKEEMYHNLIFSPVDESYHTVSCALNGTLYCGGLDVEKSAHIILVYPTDALHHQSICDYCGFTGKTQECIFDYNIIENEEQIQKYCECGNYITIPKETISENNMGDESGKESQSRESDSVESISENQTQIIEEVRH